MSEARRSKLQGVKVTALIFTLFFLLQLLYRTFLSREHEFKYHTPVKADLYSFTDLLPYFSEARSPLLMAYLAFIFRLNVYRQAAIAVAMLLISACALTGVYHLARRVSNREVASATTICTALYPVFFEQAALIQPDTAVMMFTIWALYFYLPPARAENDAPPKERAPRPDAASQHENSLRDGRGWGRRRIAAACLFLLASLMKETALLAPLALFACEMICRRKHLTGAAGPAFGRKRPRLVESLLLLAPLLSLVAWFAFDQHFARLLPDSTPFQFHAESFTPPALVARALGRRFWQVTGHANLFVLTLCGLAAMAFPALSENETERPRIFVAVQLKFAAVILFYVVGMAASGDAAAAREMLPVMPLPVLIWVSTLRRRVRRWSILVWVVCAGFLVKMLFDLPR